MMLPIIRLNFMLLLLPDSTGAAGTVIVAESWTRWLHPVAHESTWTHFVLPPVLSTGHFPWREATRVLLYVERVSVLRHFKAIDSETAFELCWRPILEVWRIVWLWHSWILPSNQGPWEQRSVSITSQARLEETFRGVLWPHNGSREFCFGISAKPWYNAHEPPLSISLLIWKNLIYNFCHFDVHNSVVLDYQIFIYFFGIWVSSLEHM